MTFQNILGHERPLLLLKSALGRSGLAHAYLFHGPDGIGKRTVARTLAQWAHCTAPDSIQAGEPCGNCTSCRTLEAGTHPDITTIEPAGNVIKTIKIDQVREIQSQLVLKPVTGRMKFVIFDNAHQMNHAAANALLKTLEEPPDQTVLILITSQPHALPATVLSRCQRILFSALTDQQVLKLLQEKHPQDPGGLENLAALARGSAGWALTSDPVDLQTQWHRFREVLQGLPSRDIQPFLDLSQAYAQDRETTERALQWIGLWLREAFDHQIQPRQSVRTSLPARLTTGEIMVLTGWIHWIWKALNRNLNRRLALETLLLEINRVMRQRKNLKSS